MANFETIGGRIVEAHPRLGAQWRDLYGPGWVEVLIRVYATGEWRFADTDRIDRFSVVLFAPYGHRYRRPFEAVARAVRAMPGVSSVQISFHEDRDPAHHPMPPGGFRVAIVNARSLEAGQAALAAVGD
jgi:hypothetical protein